MAVTKAKILILKSHPQSLKAVEVFLKNRELDFYVTSDLKQALVYLLKERPQFFLLAADHPNKKVRLLPKLLKPVLKTSILGFTEASNNSSLFALQELNAAYVLYPPISGPAIIRGIARIEKEIEKIQSSDLNEQLAHFDFSPQVVTVDPNMLELQDLLKSENTADYVYIPAETISVGPVTPPSVESLKEIAKVFQSSMDSLRQSPPVGQEIRSVGLASRMTCLVVEAGSLRGYLLVAFPAEVQVDEDFIAGIRDGFLKYSRSLGQDIVSPLVRLKTMELKTQSVEFLKWADAHAEFLLRTSHGGSEVVAAFLPHQELPADFKKSEDGKMCELSLGELVTDKVLEFDVFVHLPVNGKYVLYNKKGRTMFDNQKKRLLDRGVTHVHFRSEDMPDYYLYQAQNHVNSSIDKFAAESTSAAAL